MAETKDPLPTAGLYDGLRLLSINLGEVDHRILMTGRPQEVVRDVDGRCRLFRVGDAVASRNMHPAIFDALPLAKDI